MNGDGQGTDDENGHGRVSRGTLAAAENHLHGDVGCGHGRLSARRLLRRRVFLPLAVAAFLVFQFAQEDIDKNSHADEGENCQDAVSGHDGRLFLDAKIKTRMPDTIAVSESRCSCSNSMLMTPMLYFAHIAPA
ncbi:MAG: hypothetical protein MPK36_08225 [Gammaproteobacteria bacterium]|nr:hypothetical protein [Gammaproteobacteria bacterium]